MSEFIDCYDQYTGHDTRLGELIASESFDYDKDIIKPRYEFCKKVNDKWGLNVRMYYNKEVGE